MLFRATRCRLRVMNQLISYLMRRDRVGVSLIFVFLLGLGVHDCLVSTAVAQSQNWESSIRKFEDDDKANPPKPGGIVFTGASSIRLWDTLVAEMKPLDVINRGFGGSQYTDLNRRERRPGIRQNRPFRTTGNMDLHHVHQAFLFEVERVAENESGKPADSGFR